MLGKRLYIKWKNWDRWWKNTVLSISCWQKVRIPTLFVLTTIFVHFLIFIRIDVTINLLDVKLNLKIQLYRLSYLFNVSIYFIIYAFNFLWYSLKGQWKRICVASNNKKKRLLCELHFDTNAFDTARQLKPDAVPTIECKCLRTNNYVSFFNYKM